MVAGDASDGHPASNFGARCARDRHDRAAPRFSDLVHDIWPVKAPAAISQYAGCPDRTARAYASGCRVPKAPVVFDLLRGREGFRFLAAIMAGSTVTWWIVLQHERHLARLARDIFSQLETVMR